jgi:hypothetical protein
MNDQLQVAVETWLAALPENEFRALCARTREPDEALPPLGVTSED